MYVRKNVNMYNLYLTWTPRKYFLVIFMYFIRTIFNPKTWSWSKSVLVNKCDFLMHLNFHFLADLLEMSQKDALFNYSTFFWTCWPLKKISGFLTTYPIFAMLRNFPVHTYVFLNISLKLNQRVFSKGTIRTW